MCVHCTSYVQVERCDGKYFCCHSLTVSSLRCRELIRPCDSRDSKLSSTSRARDLSLDALCWDNRCR